MKRHHPWQQPWQQRKLALAVTLVALAGNGFAQEPQAAPQAGEEQSAAPESEIEEVVITSGRLRTGAQAVIIERITQPYSAEVVGIEQITRAGDSDIALALRRVTGLTLVDNKFIYVRGLGERYSSATLNGAEIPSPELSRNVIPLDLFPTSILESVKVHKAYSADQPAAFGGGNVNIRTRGVPNNPLFSVSAGSGWNSENSSEGLSTLGNKGEMPYRLRTAIDTYQGDISPANITRLTYPGVSSPSDAQRQEGQAINRELMLALNRDVELEEDESINPNMNLTATAGNSWFVNDSISVGALGNVSYGTSLRNQNQREQNFANPERDNSEILRTFESENTTAALNFNLDYEGKHVFDTNSYVLRNDEDQASIIDAFNADFQSTEGRQRRTYLSRLEKRELVVNQVLGRHSIEDGEFGVIPVPAPFTSIDINWFYSLATATTEVPNAVSVQATNVLNPETREFLGTQINAGTSTQFNFLDLEDEVESSGVLIEAPFVLGAFEGSLGGGGSTSRKTREYIGWTANLFSGPTAPRTGTPGEIFRDEVLGDPSNDFAIFMGSNFGTESYLAAETKDAMFGTLDLTYNGTWRLNAGVRWENFARGVLPINLLDYSGSYIQQLQQALQDENQKLAVEDADYFPSVALTYMHDGFLGAENFQLRFGYGETVVRPDLREFADVQFIDPELNNRVQGNPNLVFSQIKHYDVRSEFFYDGGDNFTVSLFYKEIANPIERVQLPGPQDGRLLSFQNADSGEIYGIELEGLKSLPYGLFLSGNVVLSDSELVFPVDTNQTSQKRRLTGHSKYALNTQLGFDSEDGMHSASLVYNVFGERVFFGGLSPSPDSYEQPFHSLDMVYSFFPNDNMTVRLRAQNVLDRKRRFEQAEVTTIEIDVGIGVRADLQWNF